MKKFTLLLALLMLFLLAACSGQEDSANEEENAAAKADDNNEEQASEETQTIEYLGEEYTLPDNIDQIVITGAMEAMEDAVSLGVEPAGGVTIAGEFPELYASVTQNTESIGEKQQPNFEKILELKPDVILGTDKFPDEVIEKLGKIAPTIQVSHISSDWQDNLYLMAELSGDRGKADKLLEDYQAELENVKPSVQKEMEGKKVAAIRIRGGEMFIYPEDVFFNSVLYEQLELDVPEQVEKAEAQEALSVEQLAAMNPDYLIIQVQDGDDDENNKVYEDMKQNPIVQNVTAFKEDQVFVNMVDPLLEGGPAYSRTIFLEQLLENIQK